MKRHTKLSSEVEQQQRSEKASQQSAGREFSSVEDALRYDAQQVVVPPAVGKRLASSIKNLPQTGSPWWRKLFKS